MKSRRFLLVLVAVVALLAPIGRATAETAFPEGVPNLADPATLNHFAPVGVGQVAGDPDFPVLILANLQDDFPQFVLMILDARNGKETWSVRDDAALFLVLFTDATTMKQGFLDEGFAENGKASGRFIAAGPEGVEELLAKFRQAYPQAKLFAHRGQVI